MVRNGLRRLVRRPEHSVLRYSPAKHPRARHLNLMQTQNSNIVFDVGGNTGQYASQFRELGYSGYIVSFEPLASVYCVLAHHANRAAHWGTVNIAQNDHNDSAEINSANS